jgi:hypothetical protein
VNPPGPHWERPPARSEAGISLLEVLVYAVLASILIVLAMGALGTVQKGVSTSHESARVSGDADETMALMGRDLRSMGLKRLFYSPAPGSFADTLVSEASLAPLDSSSFIHRDGNRYDTLTILRTKLDRRGAPVGVDTVTYSVNPTDRILTRHVAGDAPASVGTGIEAMQFEYGVSALSKVLVDERTIQPGNWTATPAPEVSASGSGIQIAKTSAGSVTCWQSATGFSTSNLRRYAFDLRAQGDAPLLANAATLAVIIASPSGTVQASEPFMVGAAAMDFHIEIEAPACGNCRAGIRMDINAGPGAAGGKLLVSSFALSEIAQGDYTWSPTPTLAQKKGTRAIRIYMLAGSGIPLHGAVASKLALANTVLTFNDGVGRSLLDQVVPTPNNGP